MGNFLSEIASAYKTFNFPATKRDRQKVSKTDCYIDYIFAGGRLGDIDYYRVKKNQITSKQI